LATASAGSFEPGLAAVAFVAASASSDCFIRNGFRKASAVVAVTTLFVVDGFGSALGGDESPSGTSTV
jgi:hypothetical protein